jgi:hypothetical protein
MNNFTVVTARDSNPSPYSDQFAIKSELTALTTLPPHCVNKRVKKLLLLLKLGIRSDVLQQVFGTFDIFPHTTFFIFGLN